MARPRQPGRNTEARSFRQLKRFRHVINSDEVFGTHTTRLPTDEHILGTQAAILVFALCAYVLAALFAERRQHEAQQNLLIAELDHRVKNVLARVGAVAMHTYRGASTMDEFVRALDGRIQSMGAAHWILSQGRWTGVGLAELMRRQLAPYTIDANTTISGPDAMLTSGETQALAMVIHELVTNAAKHGALSSQDGRVSVSWDRTGIANAAARLTIRWREQGGEIRTPSVQQNRRRDRSPSAAMAEHSSCQVGLALGKSIRDRPISVQLPAGPHR